MRENPILTFSLPVTLNVDLYVL